MTSRVLLVAYHFPPIKGSSGLLRTLGFVRDLGQHRWEASVLTAHPRAYPATSDDMMGSVPEDTRVVRAYALDVARDLAIAGRFPDWLALPDRWWPWFLWAVSAGLCEIRRQRPQAVWSTYPIATSHLIACVLHRLSGTPWIADFRDPMVEQDQRTGEWVPESKLLRRARLWVERLCVRHAARLVFCTESARQICVERYGARLVSRTRVIPNGFDEELFHHAEQGWTAPPRQTGLVTLVHSGLLYPTPDRDPTALFDALATLKHRGVADDTRLRVVLRASGHDDIYREAIERRGIADIVELAPPIAYADALREMLSASGLLLLQGYTSNPAIPAKLYEYIRARRPVLALVDANGESARLVRDLNLGEVVPLESAQAIEIAIERFLADPQALLSSLPGDETIRRYRRSARAVELARLLDEVACAESPERAENSTGG